MGHGEWSLGTLRNQNTSRARKGEIKALYKRKPGPSQGAGFFYFFFPEKIKLRAASPKFQKQGTGGNGRKGNSGNRLSSRIWKREENKL